MAFIVFQYNFHLSTKGLKVYYNFLFFHKTYNEHYKHISQFKALKFNTISYFTIMLHNLKDVKFHS